MALPVTRAHTANLLLCYRGAYYPLIIITAVQPKLQLQVTSNVLFGPSARTALALLGKQGPTRHKNAKADLCGRQRTCGALLPIGTYAPSAAIALSRLTTA